MSDNDFNDGLDALDNRMRALFPAAVGKAGEHVRAVAAPLTPVETGQLVGSADVQVFDNEAHVLYPGPYARRQHFELDYHHNTGQALYLEQPMITEAAPAIQIMADTLGDAF